MVKGSHYHVHRLDGQGDEHKHVGSFSVEKTALQASSQLYWKAGLGPEKEALVDDAGMAFAKENEKMNGVMMRNHRQGEVESLDDEESMTYDGIRQYR